MQSILTVAKRIGELDLSWTKALRLRPIVLQTLVLSFLRTEPNHLRFAAENSGKLGTRVDFVDFIRGSDAHGVSFH